MANDNTLEGVSWPVNELGELILTQGSGSGNIVGQVPLSFVPVDARTGTVKAVFGRSPNETASPTVPLTLYLSEGRTVSFKATSATGGSITKYLANGTVDFTVGITGNATSQTYGPYSGLQQFVVTCTTGSIDATTSEAVLSSPQFVASANGGVVTGPYGPVPITGVPATGSSVTTFDTAGRIATVTQTTGTVILTWTYTYNTASQIATVVYNNGVRTSTSTYSYDANGRQNGVTVV